MAEDNGIFLDGDNLQSAIGRSIQENKALLCFISDDGDESTKWEVALLDDEIQEGLLSKTVPLRLTAGSEQAGYLNSICPISSCPSIVMIHRGEVMANWQHGQIPFEALQNQLGERFGTSTGQPISSTSVNEAVSKLYIDLPPPDGRMRLPNNAYDQFRTLTQRAQTMGVSDKVLLRMQLRWLASMNIDIMTKFVNETRSQVDTLTEAPMLPEEITARLLNTPASMLNPDEQTSNSSLNAATTQASSASSSSQNRPRQESSPGTWPSPQPATSAAATSPSSSSSSSSTRPPHPSANTSQATQRADYIAAQKSREAARAAERERARAQKAAEQKARREAEAARAAEQRRLELQELRKANSTRPEPKSTDVRLQIRLFDGSTIRNSFADDATIAIEVRGWIDDTVKAKAATMSEVQAGLPYNLKLILAPKPNRTIEAGEEDSALSDVEGINSSATMVMVPVKSYVGSYTSTGGGGVTGLLGSAISGGVGMVGSAAGWAVGGLGRLIGGGGGQATTTAAQASQEELPQVNRSEAANTGSRGTARVRTLADQRRDADDESKRRGTQLYNGMGLNVQPRKDDDGNAGK